MSGALGGLSEFDTELLRRNRFCIGVKRGSEYQCGGEADENAINNAIDLLIEAIKRLIHWRIWNEWWIIEWMDELLERRDRVELQLQYNKVATSNILTWIDKIIGYIEQLWWHWHQIINNEIRELIESLVYGKAEIIIRGEDAVSVHYKHVTLDAHRLKGDVVTQLLLEDFGGVAIETPDIFAMLMNRDEYIKFINEILPLLRKGLEDSDGFEDEGKTAMGTAQSWQVLLWLLLYPGNAHLRIGGVNVNKERVTFKWFLRSSEYDSLKDTIINVENLNTERLLIYLFSAILGDGSVETPYFHSRKKPRIRLTGKDDRWMPLLKKLYKEFRWHKSGITVEFTDSNAIRLAKSIINALPQALKILLDALDFKKWRKLKEISSMETKFERGEMKITLGGYGFTVSIKRGSVELIHFTKDESEIRRIIDELKAKFGNEFYIRVNKSSRGYSAIIIPVYAIEKYEEIRQRVVEVLCRKFKKVKDEKKRRVIIKHLRRLTLTGTAINSPSPSSISICSPNDDSIINA